MPSPPLLQLGTVDAPITLLDGPALATPLLVFDTSTECMALAVCGPAGAYTLTAAGGAAASATLLPQALRLLAHAGLTLHSVRAIAFGSGPGAFTGLRTACAVAQGLGLGLAVPLLPIDSLLMVAEDARRHGERSGGAADQAPFEVVVAMDARMNEVYSGRYRWQPTAAAGGSGSASGLSLKSQHDWQVVQPPQLCDLPALAQAWAWAPPPVLAGSALAAFGPRLPVPAHTLCLATEHNRGEALLHLAARAWAAGLAVDAAQALPRYGRDKVAQTTQEREQAREQAREKARAP